MLILASTPRCLYGPWHATRESINLRHMPQRPGFGRAGLFDLWPGFVSHNRTPRASHTITHDTSEFRTYRNKFTSQLQIFVGLRGIGRQPRPECLTTPRILLLLFWTRLTQQGRSDLVHELLLVLIKVVIVDRVNVIVTLIRL
jgi:hypothetical protein